MISSIKYEFSLILLALLAGCSSTAGPAYSVWSIDLPNGGKSYRVDCYGLLEGAEVCRRKAAEICDKKPVLPLKGVVAMNADGNDQDNARELTFRCGEAPAAGVFNAPVASTTRLALHEG
ncbi:MULTISPECIES: hypothetical protein [Burkholderia]|uniref:hypothetical protein n=1 Tax=Burkholderia TaxID=32008 RepID=UPI001269C299|nr:MULTISPECIES: hypothetical protein [Burkholderia]